MDSAQTNLEMQKIHVIDFEGSMRSGIVEYGVVTLVGGDIEACYTRLCKPSSPMDSSECAVHGIWDVSEGVLPVSADWELFAELRKTGVLAAHHASVENAFLESVWPVASVGAHVFEGYEAKWGPWVDSCALYKKCYPGLSSYKLGDLVEAFSLRDDLQALAELHCPKGRCRAHAALYDALASALLLRALLERPELQHASLHWLVVQSQNAATANTLQQQRLF